jgi:hypothetical protein
VFLLAIVVGAYAGFNLPLVISKSIHFCYAIVLGLLADNDDIGVLSL